MKSLYAIYDRKDNFIDCAFGYKNILKKRRFYRNTKKNKSK